MITVNNVTPTQRHTYKDDACARTRAISRGRWRRKRFRDAPVTSVCLAAWMATLWDCTVCPASADDRLPRGWQTKQRQTYTSFNVQVVLFSFLIYLYSFMLKPSIVLKNKLWNEFWTTYTYCSPIGNTLCQHHWTPTRQYTCTSQSTSTCCTTNTHLHNNTRTCTNCVQMNDSFSLIGAQQKT